MKYILSLLLALLPFAAGAQDTHIPGNLYVGGGGAFTGSVTAANFTNAGLTATRVPFAGVGGLLTDSANLTFDSGTNTLTTVNAAISGLTANRIPYASAGGLLTDSNALRFTSGTGTLTATLFSGALNGTVGATTPASGVFTSLTDSALTITRVPYAGTSGQLLDSASMFFNSGTGELSATKFAGALNGTVGATTPTTGRFTQIDNTGPTSLGTASPSNYVSIGGAGYSSDTWDSLYVGQNGVIAVNNVANGGVFYGSNFYYTGGLYRYGKSAFAQSFGFNYANNGEIDVLYASSGTAGNIISWTSGQVFTPTGIKTNALKDSGGRLIFSSTAPSIASGFGTSPACTVCNNTAAFEITVGTGGTDSTGSVTMPTASNGWVCNIQNLSNPLAVQTVQNASSAASVSVINLLQNGLGATAFIAGAVLLFQCTAF